MRLAVILALLLTPTLAMAKANFYAQTNHFALKKGEEWSWDKVAKIPNIKWHNKKPQKNPSFSSYDVNGGMGKYGSLSASGSKASPQSSSLAPHKLMPKVKTVPMFIPFINYLIKQNLPKSNPIAR